MRKKEAKSDNVMQLNIFDYISQGEEKSSWMQEGTIIYVPKGVEVFEYRTTGKCWLSAAGTDTYYGAECITANGKPIALTKRTIGTIAFLTREEANEKVKLFAKQHDCIRMEDMNIVSVKAFSYVRECDQRTLTAFYCELGNGMLYCKGFITYCYLMKPENKEKAIKKFMEQSEFKYNNPVEVTNYIPPLKTMYKVIDNCGWDYTELACSHVGGYSYVA